MQLQTQNAQAHFSKSILFLLFHVLLTHNCFYNYNNNNNNMSQVKTRKKKLKKQPSMQNAEAEAAAAVAAVTPQASSTIAVASPRVTDVKPTSRARTASFSIGNSRVKSSRVVVLCRCFDVVIK
jgi:type VI protein secretion system component VasK